MAETGTATAKGTSAAPSITHGLTINAGDVIVAVVHLDSGSAALSDNNGSTPFTESFEEASLDGSVYAIYVRVAGASEPSSYAWSSTVSANWSIVMRVRDDVDNTTPWDVAPSASTRGRATSGTTATAPTMTTTVDGAIGLLMAVEATSVTSHVFSAPTNGYGTLVQTVATSPYLPNASATRVWATAGATGTSAMTLAVSGDWVIHQVALRPEAAVVPRVNPPTVIQQAIQRASYW